MFIHIFRQLLLFSSTSCAFSIRPLEDPDTKHGSTKSESIFFVLFLLVGKHFGSITSAGQWYVFSGFFQLFNFPGAPSAPCNASTEVSLSSSNVLGRANQIMQSLGRFGCWCFSVLTAIKCLCLHDIRNKMRKKSSTWKSLGQSAKDSEVKTSIG